MFGSVKNQFQKTVLCVETALFFPEHSNFICFVSNRSFLLFIYFSLSFFFILFYGREHLLLKCITFEYMCAFFGWLSARALVRMSDTTTMQLYWVCVCVQAVYFVFVRFMSWCDRTRQCRWNEWKIEMEKPKSHMNYDLFSIFNIYVYLSAIAIAMKQNRKSHNNYSLHKAMQKQQNQYIYICP